MSHLSSTEHAEIRSACAEETERHYVCKVMIRFGVSKDLGEVALKPATLHAVVSKDGQRVIVEDLDSV